MSTQNKIIFPEWDAEERRYNNKAEVIVRNPNNTDADALSRFEESFGRMSKLLAYDLGRYKSKKKMIERRTKKQGKLNPRYVADELKKAHLGQELTQKVYDRRIVKSMDEEDFDGKIVGLLLDQSGSTRFTTSEGHRRIDLIKYSALTLGRALNAVGEKFYMYSFHSSRNVYPTYMETLKGIGENWTESLEGRIAALEHTADTEEFNNVDGSAIRYINQTMQMYGKAEKVVFLLTDGNPHTDNEYYQNNFAYEDTMKAMEEGKALGIKYIYLTINPDSSADQFLGKIDHTTIFCKRYTKMSEVVEGLTRVYEKFFEIDNYDR